MKGLVVEALSKEEVVQIADQLVQDSAKEFGHSLVTEKHPTMPLLDKFFYKDGGLLHEKKYESSDEQLSSWSELKKEHQSKLLTNNDGHAVPVKLENPLSLKVKQFVVTLRSAKTVLEKKECSCKDVLAALEAEGKQEFTPKIAELNTALTGLSKFLSNLRATTHKADSMPASDITEDTVTNLQALVDQAVHHSDGAESLIKRSRSLL